MQCVCVWEGERERERETEREHISIYMYNVIDIQATCSVFMHNYICGGFVITVW